MKSNFRWVAEQVKEIQSDLSTPSGPQAVMFMTCKSELPHFKRISELCEQLGVKCCRRHITTPQNSNDALLKLLSKMDGDSLTNAMCIITTASPTSGLGSVLSGNTMVPVINCPPTVKGRWDTVGEKQNLPCFETKARSADRAALAAAQILAQHDVRVWNALRARRLNLCVSELQENSDVQSLG